jgi:hypothetical protein
VILLLVAGCTKQVDVVQITPTLKCEHEVKCNVIEWSVGIRQAGVSIGGTHVGCHCVDKGD